MIQFAARTHPGRRAGENEDAIGSDAERQLWFVADGMGGHAAGGVASSIVKDTLLKVEGAPESLTDLVLAAHAAVVSAADSNPEYKGMGSTLVCARIVDAVGSVVWVGDSRAYLWRGRTLKRLTQDHSFAQILSAEQGLSATEIRSHPARHVVTQTLGLGTPEPSLSETRLRSGDWILLCSDGLTDELEDPDITEALSASRTVEQAADALIERALKHGGRDNVSVVVVAYDQDAKAGPPRGRMRTAGIILLSILSGAGFALACAAAYWYFFGVR
jgi:protein phosphatase